MTFGDSATVRYISDARVSAPFVVGDVEYVKFTIVGQSFLMNQIRHMVGILIDVVRGAAHPQMLSLALGNHVVKLPLAPAEGLYLAQIFFTAYDSKFGKTHPSLTYLSAAATQRQTQFREAHIWTHIHSIVRQYRPFEVYISSFLDSPMSYRMHVPAQLKDVVAKAAAGRKDRKRWRNDEDDAEEGEGDASGSVSRGSSSTAAAAAAPSYSSAATAAAAAAAAAPDDSSKLHRSFSAYSKLAKSNAEFKRKQKEERRQGNMYRKGGCWGDSEADAAAERAQSGSASGSSSGGDAPVPAAAASSSAVAAPTLRDAAAQSDPSHDATVTSGAI